MKKKMKQQEAICDIASTEAGRRSSKDSCSTVEKFAEKQTMKNKQSDKSEFFNLADVKQDKTGMFWDLGKKQVSVNDLIHIGFDAKIPMSESGDDHENVKGLLKNLISGYSEGSEGELPSEIGSEDIMRARRQSFENLL